MTAEPFRTILNLLREHGESYGLELVKCSDQRLKRGLIYVYLTQLETAGLVASRQEPPEATDPLVGLPRRLYSITDNGRRELSKENPPVGFGGCAPA